MLSSARLGLGLLAMALTAATLSGCSEPAANAADECVPPECVVLQPSEPIYIGSLLYLDDPIGRDSAAIVRMSVDYLDGAFDGINGQLLGRPVLVLEEEEKCTADSGAAAAGRFAADRTALAVIGTTCSGSAYGAAAPILSDAQILLVSSTNTSPLLTEVSSRERYYFRTAPNDILQAAVAGNFVIDALGLRSAATWSLANAYSEPLADGFAQRIATLGGSVVSRLLYPEDDDLKPNVAELVRTRPDAVFLPMYERECIAAVRAIRAEPRLKETRLLVGEGCQTRDFVRELGSLADGVFASGPDASGLDAQAFYRREFLPAYQRLTNAAAPITSSAATFDAVNLVFWAIRRAAVPLPGGAIAIRREDLRKAMLAVQNYPGMSGTLGCSPLGDCVRSARMSIYEAPQWPVTGSDAPPVFSETLDLAVLSRGL